MTIHERVAAARTRLLAAGLPQPEADLDARLLAQWLLGWDAVRFLTHADETEPAGFHPRYADVVGRRAAREPLAYVTGRQEFFGRSFEVSAAVLIPRPETEAIVEAVLEIDPGLRDPIEVADVGTGSGCLAVTLALERPTARLLATDVSSAALAVARRNAERHGVADRVGFLRADLLDGVQTAFDVIVANPPYVPERDRASLQPEVRDHEPAGALFAADEGLAVIARLLEQAVPRLKPGGRLVFEFGYGQSDRVRAAIGRTLGLSLLEIRRDLQGISRTALVRRV
jgi:release factor glutamine methyltransferase